MTALQIVGCVFLLFLIVSHAADFFSDSKKRNDKLYDKTAKDVNFNKLKRK